MNPTSVYSVIYLYLRWCICLFYLVLVWTSGTYYVSVYSCRGYNKSDAKNKIKRYVLLYHRMNSYLNYLIYLIAIVSRVFILFMAPNDWCITVLFPRLSSIIYSMILYYLYYIILYKYTLLQLHHMFCFNVSSIYIFPQLIVLVFDNISYIRLYQYLVWGIGK